MFVANDNSQFSMFTPQIVRRTALQLFCYFTCASRLSQLQFVLNAHSLSNTEIAVGSICFFTIDFKFWNSPSLTSDWMMTLKWNATEKYPGNSMSVIKTISYRCFVVGIANAYHSEIIISLARRKFSIFMSNEAISKLSTMKILNKLIHSQVILPTCCLLLFFSLCFRFSSVSLRAAACSFTNSTTSTTTGWTQQKRKERSCV